MEVPDLISNAVKRFPERACVVEGDRRLTFAEVDARASQLAAACHDAGLRTGDRVALLAYNELEYLEIQIGAARAGLILVPLNYRLAVPELRHIIEDSKPRLLIHGPGLGEAATRLGVERTWHLGVGGVGRPYDAVLGATSATATAPLRAADPAALMYTSGTTGRPKGAIISNGAIWAQVNTVSLEDRMLPGDVFVQALPMFHIASNQSWAFAYNGATNIMVKVFDPAGLVRCLEEHRATHVLLVPTMISMLCDEPALAEADLDSLRLVLYGASPIAPEQLRRAMQALSCDFLQLYGMTETGAASVLRSTDHDPAGRPELLASAGTDAIGARTRIVDADDRLVPAGTVGEIACRGPGIMDGYWGDPDASAHALRGGWMHTGDMGFHSEDGYLYITDRLKDMIVSGGENVYPREVEDAMYEHPDVREVAVIGIPHERWGESVHAVVVTAQGTSSQPDWLLDHCRERLARYKVPRSVEFVDELPRNATGKVLKRVLREPYRSDSDPTGASSATHPGDAT
jgi:acyl-CoA synthetase (AMP-forming)/AMP-acid ligase II